jgi:hypothetical protein
MSPILRVMFNPVVRIFVHSVRGFHTFMSKKIIDGEFSAGKFSKTLDSCHRQIEWWSGPLHDAYNSTYKLYTSDLAEVVALFGSGSGVTTYTVYNIVMDKIKMIAHRAVYTFGSLAQSVSEGDVASVLTHVTQLFIHDCYYMTKAVMSICLKTIVDAFAKELIIKPAGEMIEPIQEQVDAIPIPGLSTLISLHAMLDSIVNEVLSLGIDGLMSANLQEVKSTLDVTATELGLAAIKI